MKETHRKRRCEKELLYSKELIVMPTSEIRELTNHFVEQLLPVRIYLVHLQTAPILRKAILIFTSSYRTPYQISLQKQQKHINLSAK